MKKSNKKGFTLIELLAVIVVLAIIMVIATQSVTKAIEKSRLSAFESSYNMIIKQVKSKIMEKELDSSITVECSTDCYSKYGISSDDYNLQIKKFDNNYLIKLSGKGKFSNIKSNELNTAKTNGDISSNATIGEASIAIKIGADGKEYELDAADLNNFLTEEELAAQEAAQQAEKKKAEEYYVAITGLDYSRNNNSVTLEQGNVTIRTRTVGTYASCSEGTLSQFGFTNTVDSDVTYVRNLLTEYYSDNICWIYDKNNALQGYGAFCYKDSNNIVKANDYGTYTCK